ncbi:hypothetical protein L1887_23974 [Cichorium endivia]|nr:hypothetical protein L1887_23974 [Cichorium endivia]
MKLPHILSESIIRETDAELLEYSDNLSPLNKQNQDHLRLESVLDIKKLGSVLLIDLANIVGVDLYHVEKQAQVVEINDRLQECSLIALADIAAQLQVHSELLVTVWSLDLDPGQYLSALSLEPRLGSLHPFKILARTLVPKPLYLPMI